MEMTKKTKVFVSVTLVCALSLTIFTGCTFGFRTPDYIAFGWSPIAQEGAIWRSTDGTIVLDLHDDEVSGNLTADGYIISGDTKIYIEDVALSFRDDYMDFRSSDSDLYVAFKCKFKNKSKFTATVIEIMDERFNFLNIGDKFVFIKDQE